MAEYSLPWPGVTIGDAGPYSDEDWHYTWGMLFGSQTVPYNNRGVIRNWLNELEVTDGGANTADVDTGAGLVYGKFYRNTAVVNLNIPSSVGAWREDLVCLQANWTTQTIRIYRHNNPADGAPYPAPTQASGATWEIPLAAVRINNAGAITLITDLRDYVSDLMQPKSFFVRPSLLTGAAADRLGQGQHEGVRINANLEECWFEFMVREDFCALKSVHLVYIMDSSNAGTFDVTVDTDWGGCDEAYNAHSDTVTVVGTGVADNLIGCCDITAAYTPNLAAGDFVGSQAVFNNLTNINHLILLGLRVRYE